MNERTCVGCRRRLPQQQLLRFYRDSRGIVRADPRRVAAGRGVYTCPDRRCLASASNRGGFARGLRTKAHPDPEELAGAALAEVEQLVTTWLRHYELDGRARRQALEPTGCTSGEPGWLISWRDQAWRLLERRAAWRIEQMEWLHGRLLPRCPGQSGP